jgi:class 3 adenylate cyclase
MGALPTGTVTFLFTDIEGSTRLWEQHPEAARSLLARHDELIEQTVEAHRGQVVRPRGEGDSRFCVFARATDAVAAAATVQQALHAEPWQSPAPLKVRMALHTGEADLREGDYYGSAVNRCARLRAIAHGGQTLVSGVTADLVRETLPRGVTLRDLGLHRLKDLAQRERVHQLTQPDLPAEFPPLLSRDVLPNNLPLQVTSFIGREKELAEVKQLLQTTRLSRMERITSCSSLSVQEGNPSGRNFPFFFGICTRRTGVHRKRSWRSSSMRRSIFTRLMPSTVSRVAPGVSAPLLAYKRA